MTTIYPGIEQSLVPQTPSMSMFGSDWTVIRPSEGTVSSAPTLTNVGTIALFGVVPNNVDRARRGLPDVDVFGADYFGWGPTTLDIRVNDILISIDYPDTAFLLLGPARPMGPLIAPLGLCAVPAEFDEAILDDEGQPILGVA